ncbi:MAG: 3-isopropylmalate dehydrogenase [SAR324 cluster bacterium]|nr:3-isopropylmalate dehydrogenase [SAR324 cluster bacterium]
MNKKVLVMHGDGIGPEVTRQGLKVLNAVAPQAGLVLDLEDTLIGGAAYDETGSFLPSESLSKAKQADAILFGAVGGPKWAKLDGSETPEKGLLNLRKELDLFANLRPVTMFSELVEASTLKQEVVEGTDLMVIRELTGGIYFGEPRGSIEVQGRKGSRNTMVYMEDEVERIIRVGFDMAGKRRNKLTSVDKSNVLDVSKMWRSIAERLASEYPGVELDHLYVDAAAMELIRDPRQFDTIVTGNLFGDILSDEASMLTGSIGMLPSASIGSEFALYEPIHGSAPDIAGQDKANPLASILSVGMMFRYTFGMPQIDEAIHSTVNSLLSKYRTPDIMVPGKTPVGCEEMGDMMLQELEQTQAIPAA